MAQPTKDKIDRSFKYLLYSRAFRSVAIIYMSLAFSLYLTALGVGLVYIGLIAAGTILFMIFLTMLAGAIGDRYGFRMELLVTEAIALIGAVLIAATTSLTYIIPGMVIMGLGGGAGSMRGAFSPGTNAFIANNYTDGNERVKKYSLITMVGSAFSIGGSLLFSAVTPLAGVTGQIDAYRYMFVLASAILAFSVISILMLKENKRPIKTTKIMKKSSFKYSLKVMVANSLGGAGIGLAIPLLPLWFKLAYDARPLEIGIIFGLTYIATTIGAYLSARYSQRFNALNMASYTRVVGGAMLIAMAFSPFLIIAGILYVSRSMLGGLGNPSRNAINIKGVHTEDYGTASSIQGVAMRVAQLSSGASGYLMDAALPLPVFAGGLFQLFSGFGYKLLFKGDDKNIQQKGKADRNMKL